MNSYIKYHQKEHPEAMIQDIVKLLYQNEFAGGHMIKDQEMVKQYYFSELEDLADNNKQNLYDIIGPNMIRVNMIPYRNAKLSHNYLLDAFIKSANDNYGKTANFQKELNNLPIDAFLKTYDMKPIHHTSIYSQLYYPHYRVIEKQYVTLEMKEYQIRNFLSSIDEFSIIALEGKCASGKSTLTSKLINDDITIISCDDFFLPEISKTKERMQEIGGNIDYEAIKALLQKIKPNSTLKYQIFDCRIQSYITKTVNIKKIVILEGVYSYHQSFRNLIDYLIFLTINNEEQNKRLKKRELYERFINEWIPLENKYYDSFDFIANADLLI